MKPVRTVGRWRRVAVALVAGGLALTAVGCGSSDDDQSSGETVTITNTMGETKIEGTPQRIVALGNQWLDAVQALGVKPVGYIDTVGAIAGGKPVPWETGDLSDAKALTASGDITEQIASLNPDLILAPNFLVDKANYDKLSKLAPTIGSLTPAQVDPWDQQVETLGKVLHKEADATKVVADVNGKIDQVAKAHPGLKGKTFLTTLLSSPTQLMVLADPNDGSSKLFEQLGMGIPPQLVAEASAGGRLALSPERVGDLTSDFLVAASMPGQEDAFKRLPGYDALPSVRNGSITFLDVLTVSGLNTPTPLSLPYVLDKLEPGLAKVAG